MQKRSAEKSKGGGQRKRKGQRVLEAVEKTHRHPAAKWVWKYRWGKAGGLEKRHEVGYWADEERNHCYEMKTNISAVHTMLLKCDIFCQIQRWMKAMDLGFLQTSATENKIVLIGIYGHNSIDIV